MVQEGRGGTGSDTNQKREKQNERGANICFIPLTRSKKNQESHKETRKVKNVEVVGRGKSSGEGKNIKFDGDIL